MASAAAARETGGMRAFRAAVVFDGERFLTGGATVLVDGDQVVGVEPAGFKPPDGVAVEEHSGTLLPGLVDAHVHLVADGSPGSLEAAGNATDEELDVAIRANLRRQVVAGVTTVRDLGDTAYRVLHHRDAAETGLPSIVASGPPLTIAEGHCHYLGGVVDDVGIPRAVAEHAERGVDVVKVMASGGMLTPGSDQLGAQFTVLALREIVEAAHSHGLRVLAHSHSLIGIERAVAAGVDGLEHFTSLTENGPVASEPLLEQIAARGITIDPTLGFDPARMPPIDQAPPAIRALAERTGVTIASAGKFRAELMTRAHTHGIRIVSGLDAGASPAKPHGALWRAVVALVDGGLPVEVALATATSLAADDCGVPTGRLRVGTAADLLVVDGDLQSDTGALGRPVTVVVRGTVVLGGTELASSP
jgi:imidazolonepropionase-like amidohydrolase